jgi:hypothetical protein
MHPPSELPQTRLDQRQRLLATAMSLFIPGSGHLLVLGKRLRGAVWLAGWVALVLVGAGHLIPGLVLMVLAGIDAWWISSSAIDPRTRPPRGEI